MRNAEWSALEAIVRNAEWSALEAIVRNAEWSALLAIVWNAAPDADDPLNLRLCMLLLIAVEAVVAQACE